MLFSSTIFIFLFLPSVLGIYYGILKKSRKAQNVFLLAASLFFYAWGEPKFVVVMIASIFANWLFGILVHNSLVSGRTKTARAFVALDCVFNLSFLFVYKYLNFATTLIAKAFPTALVTKIALPIGISFFTFQAMSYVIDVYRAKGEVQKNILGVGLYISFFPQLIAGPIVRYETVAHEINHRKETFDDFVLGFARFVVGLAKKVILANTFAYLADKAFYANDMGTLTLAMAWLGALSYTLQIFFDFSGYSDMAIGLGSMFGFHFLENFDYPYISKSVTEFWRRWHMSLGTWFRDYVYIPLGGSRVKKKSRHIFNLFVVWLLTGIWHGADWSFVVWGLMYFVLITIEKFLPVFKKEGRIINFAKWLATMFFVVIGWVIFRADNLTRAAEYLGSMFGASPLCDGVFWAYLRQNVVMLVAGICACVPVFSKIGKKLSLYPIGKASRLIWYILLFVISVASLVSSSYNPFIYFNF